MEAGQRQDLHTDEEPLGRACPSPTDIANAYEVVRGAERVWREESRIRELRRLLRGTANLKLTRELLLLVLEELAIDDDFDELVGDPEAIPPSRFPQAIAMAIALRHSWRRDDLASVADALDLPSNTPAG